MVGYASVNIRGSCQARGPLTGKANAHCRTPSAIRYSRIQMFNPLIIEPGRLHAIRRRAHIEQSTVFTQQYNVPSPGKGVAVEKITFLFSQRASAVKGCGWTQTLMSRFFHCQIVLNRRNSGNTLSNFPCEIYLRLIGSHSYKRNLAATSDGVSISRLQPLLFVQRRLHSLRQLHICCSNRRTRGSCC